MQTAGTSLPQAVRCRSTCNRECARAYANGDRYSAKHGGNVACGVLPRATTAALAVVIWAIAPATTVPICVSQRRRGGAAAAARAGAALRLCLR